MLLLMLTMDCYFTPNAYYEPLCCSYCLLWIAILLLMLTMDLYVAPIAYYGLLFYSYCLLWTFMLLLLLTMDCYFAPNAYYGLLFYSYCLLGFYFVPIAFLGFYLPFKLYRIYVYLGMKRTFNQWLTTTSPIPTK